MEPLATSSNSNDRPATLFHYTTASGLLGIVRDNSLWATDVRFLNDEQEGIFARQFLEDAVRELRSPSLEPNHWAFHLGHDAVETFQAFLDFALDELNSEKFGIYVTCFCEDGDLLSQWRAYGSDHGYAVEFATDALESTVDGLPLYPPASGLRQVGYGRASVQRIIDEAREVLEGFNLNHPGVKAHYAALHLSSMLTTIKNPGFSEEKEWRRVIATEGIWDAQRMDSEAGLNFRASRMAIVPYLSLPIPEHAVVGIRVGPGRNADLRESGVRKLLESVGLSVNVTRSDVPWRAQ